MNTHLHPRPEPRFRPGDDWQGEVVRSVDVIGDAVSDVAVRPTLLQHRDTQVLAYYDSARRLTVAERNIHGLNWRFQRTDSTVDWDSHNYIDLGFDRTGLLHVAGNMHASPLQYWTINLHDPSEELRAVEVLLSRERERKVTYPRFLRGSDGELLFTYRDGTSGNGDFVCLRWDDETAQYKGVADHPLIDGEGKRNAYIDTNAPVLGPDTNWHMLWVWRESPDAESTHTINYACSPDLIHWKNAGGAWLSRPITEGADSVVDPVTPGQGLINNNVRLGFLPGGRPIAIYHKRDSTGSQQIWAARPDGTQWTTRQLTDWSFRWDFGGTGSLDFQIEIGDPSTTARGVLVHVRRGEDVSSFELSDDLAVISLAAASPWNPLRRLHRADGLYDRVTAGRGWAPSDPGPEWLVLHSSVPEQRDRQPAGPTPGPQPLVVMGMIHASSQSVD